MTSRMTYRQGILRSSGGSSTRPSGRPAGQRTAWHRRALPSIVTFASTVIGLVLAVASAPAASAAPVALAAPGDLAGWTQDFVDDFNGSLNTSRWGRYESSAPSSSKLLSEYDAANVYTSNGSMVLRTRNAGGGDWRSAGVSSAPGFSATAGKWAVRAKFDRGYGIWYSFLLYPKGGGWPPEVDIAEGTAGGPRVMSTFHWSTANLTDSRFNYGVDMTQWHTYGVVLSTGTLQFTIDGVVWATMNNSASPRIPMWLGIQAGAKACPGSTGECVSSTKTPTDSKIYIDWVSHWKAG